MSAPLIYTKQWNPFRLDALGLLTMLGGPEISQAIGRLTFNRFTEYLPLLGAYTVASNDFTRPLSGFTLYNITDAVVSTSFAGWFSRWLLAQEASANTSVFEWNLRHQPPRRWRSQILAASLGVFVNCTAILFPLLQGDWYGFVAALSMVVSVFVRWYLINQNRQAIDRAAMDLDARRSPDLVKTLCFLADNKVVTVLAPRNVVINCFLSTPRPSHSRIYSALRALGWIAFAAFVVTIGQATLIVQLITVGLILLATIIATFGIGSEEKMIGNMLSVEYKEYPNSSGRRIEAYTGLNLSEEEERTMVDWALVPQRRNTTWWEEYHSLRKLANLKEPRSTSKAVRGENRPVEDHTEKAKVLSA